MMVALHGLEWYTEFSDPTMPFILSGLPEDDWLIENYDRIGLIINMCEEFQNYETYGIPMVRCPTVDGVEPSVGAFMKAMKAIERFTKSGSPKKILIHCKAGVSRSASVLALWLTVGAGHSAEYSLCKIIIERPQTFHNIIYRPNFRTVERIYNYGL